MNIQAEVSYYTLTNDYENQINRFIESINDHSELGIHTSAMSTQLFGDYNDFFELLKNQNLIGENSVLVLKLSNSCPTKFERIK